MSRELGRGPLRAPPAGLRPPADPWGRSLPSLGPDGLTLDLRPMGLPAAQAVGQPPHCRKTRLHWDRDASGGEWLHQGSVFGYRGKEGWAWLSRENRQLWMWPAPGLSPLLRHQGHWWMRSRGLWFLVHDGRPWGERFLAEWGQEGFVDPSGARMIYSADGQRVGIVKPGVGAILYDARTGRELGRWSDDQLPRRLQPAAASRAPSF
ncbi:MAG: hypothetical protein KGO96_06235 [Elusimicrobia bacterium]|nr:hypothetical protein [Elusimicrobiota bacterium]MDE2425488.1 hypothetical protein [Elusimicrobiota bacterium]